jgi:uridine monophosphate synthetase
VSFFERLEARVAATGSLLCVGLDPRVESAVEARDECLRVIDLTAGHAAAFKPNSAFFEAFGPAGLEVLVEVVASVPDEIPVLLDVKRGDIGSTAQAYATAIFDVVGAAAATVSPYLGTDSLEPLLARGDLFVLCRTSNPGGAELQETPTASGEPFFVTVARAVAGWPVDRVGMVVGATEPESIARVRSVAPDHWILAPGVGAQGGSLEAALSAGLRPDGMGVLLPVSRAIADTADPGAAASELVERIGSARSATTPTRAPGLAEALFDAGCIRFGEFELKSGITSPIYLDLRTLAGHPALLRSVARAYLPLLGDGLRVAGVPLAGLPLATAVALESGRPMIYPRPPKEHGTGATVEGPFEAGDRVVVVDDVATSGISVIEAARVLRDAGLVVEHAVVLVDRGQGASQALSEEGISLSAVIGLIDIADRLEANGRLAPETAAMVRSVSKPFACPRSMQDPESV